VISAVNRWSKYAGVVRNVGGDDGKYRGGATVGNDRAIWIGDDPTDCAG